MREVGFADKEVPYISYCSKVNSKVDGNGELAVQERFVFEIRRSRVLSDVVTVRGFLTGFLRLRM